MVFDHALNQQECHFDYVSNKKENLFECHSVDNNEDLDHGIKKNATTENVTIIIQTALFQHLVTVSALF